MRLFLVILISLSAIDARVSFAKSEVLDNVDLKGTNEASFHCSAGCRVFSPTKSDTIAVFDAAGKQKKSLRELSEMNPSGFELPGGNYQLKNTGLADPKFVFYAVEKGAANYNAGVVYLNSEPIVIDADYVGPLTVMSIRGAVTFQSFYGFTANDQLPNVYASGFDSLASCRPVFTPNWATLAKTLFVVNSPVATINFKTKGAGRSVVVSPATNPSSMAIDTSAVYVSPGYVGCPSLASVGDSLYTFLPAVAGIDAFLYLTNSNGLTVSINGDYSIANQADALTLTINDEIIKLVGKKSYTKSFEGTKANLKLSWTRNPATKDGFAMQFDIASKQGKGPDPVVKTTPGKVDPVVKTTPGSRPEVTTSSVNQLAVLTSSFAISLFMCFR